MSDEEEAAQALRELLGDLQQRGAHDLAREIRLVLDVIVDGSASCGAIQPSARPGERKAPSPKKDGATGAPPGT